MKTSELEQRLKECNYRLSKMDERIKRLEEENEQLRQNREEEAVKQEDVKPEAEKFPMSSEEVDRLNNRIKALSDELYEYIGNQIRPVSYTHLDVYKRQLLYVSHSITSVQNLCDHALWLDKGHVKMCGDADTICDAYMNF